jgi:two-component system NtrC family sensor kinase
MTSSLRPTPGKGYKPLAGPSVLVIDDDAMLRRALVRGLKRRHVVVERDDAEVALAEISNGVRYDAIICDLTLGGMTGRQFLFALNAILPEQAARTLILTGTSKAALDEPLLDIIGPRFVEKPATLSEIELVLDDVFVGQARAA